MWSGSSPTCPTRVIRYRVNSRRTSSTRSEPQGWRILDGQDIVAVREAGGGIEIESTEKGEKVRCLAVVVAPSVSLRSAFFPAAA